MPKYKLSGFAPASEVLPQITRALRGGPMFMKLTPNGVSISASLRGMLPEKADVLVARDKNQIALVAGDEYEIGKYGNTWMLLKSSVLGRQLEASGWDKEHRNFAELIKGGVLITRANGEDDSET